MRRQGFFFFFFFLDLSIESRKELITSVSLLMVVASVKMILVNQNW